MNITVKTFEELNTTELYNILRLRAEVFVVEQDCVYQDLDGKDKNALHVIGTNNAKIIAYTRIFAAGLYYDIASIGRVVVAKEERRYGYGKVIVEASLEAVKEHFKEETIKISAQEYLKNFYNKLGFKELGEGYLEDGIPHIAMIKNGV
jgi:ElaA protein